MYNDHKKFEVNQFIFFFIAVISWTEKKVCIIYLALMYVGFCLGGVVSLIDDCPVLLRVRAELGAVHV